MSFLGLAPLFNTNSFGKFDAPSRLIDAARPEMVHVRFVFQSVDFSVRRRQSRPRFHADKGRVRLGRVPDSEIFKIGITQGDGAGIRLVFQRNAAAGISQNDGVVIEQLVLQGQARAVRERQRERFSRHELFFRQRMQSDSRLLGKFEIIVFKVSVRERNVKTGMTAERENKFLLVGVFHFVGDFQFCAFDFVRDGKNKAEGIGFQRVLVFRKAKHEFCRGAVGELEGTIARYAVAE